MDVVQLRRLVQEAVTAACWDDSVEYGDQLWDALSALEAFADDASVHPIAYGEAAELKAYTPEPTLVGDIFAMNFPGYDVVVTLTRKA